MLGAALLVACAGSSRDPNATVPRVLAVRLVDSVAYENELVGRAYLHRVEVRTTTSSDTLDGILTTQLPVIADDSVVHGLRYEQNYVDGAFRYTPATGIEWLPLPADLISHETPRLSPDARHLAYLARDGPGLGWLGHATVVRWPDGHPVFRSAGLQLRETDAGVGEITWTDTHQVEMLIDLSLEHGTYRVRASVQGGAQIDTLPAPRTGG